MSKALFAASLASLKDRCAANAQKAQQSCGTEDKTTCWMQCQSYEVSPVATNEQISLHALVVYVSHTTGKPEFRVERELANAFCVPNMKCLPANQYEKAVRFLVEQVPFPGFPA